MIKLQFQKPYVDKHLIANLVNVINNALYRLCWLSYEEYQHIRSLVVNEPEKAVIKLKDKLCQIANVPIKEEGTTYEK